MAYEELRTTDPRVAEIIVELMALHPDRGSFEVATNGATGEVRWRGADPQIGKCPTE